MFFYKLNNYNFKNLMITKTYSINKNLIKIIFSIKKLLTKHIIN